MVTEKPVALTMGEPAGIGGEITLKAWMNLRQKGRVFYIIDDPDRLRGINDGLGMSVDIHPIEHPAEAAAIFTKALPVLALSQPVSAVLGAPSPNSGPSVIESIETACRHAMAGDAGAVVTNPIQKDVLYDAGFAYPGHTEFVAALSGGGTPVMMLASPMLRVVPVTVHTPLRRAIEDLGTERIVEQGKITIAALRRDFGVQAPRVAVAGLNPHAGESGKLGREDAEIIAPAVSALQSLAAEVTGPVPPDALFTAAKRKTYDAALCMYHDQALIPIKALDVDRAVNVTLGLPLVRTSPDHGTAVDIAGHGIAREESLISAINMALDIAQHRAKSDAD